MSKKKENCRCLICGFIRYNTRDMAVCPCCGNRDTETFTPSHSPIMEATELLCKATNTPISSVAGKNIKQAIDILSKI